MKTENTLADGSKQVLDYGITSKSYVATERTYDASGTLTSWGSINANGDKAVSGYASDVTLHGGSGNDIFTLTNGDTIVFKAGFGNDTVRNFHSGDTGHDVLAIDHALVEGFAELNMQQQDANVIITIADHGTIALQNVTMKDLSQHDFAFF